MASNKIEDFRKYTGSSKIVRYNLRKKTFANNMAEKACKNVCQMFENSEIQTQISQYITLIISYPAKCK